MFDLLLAKNLPFLNPFNIPEGPAFLGRSGSLTFLGIQTLQSAQGFFGQCLGELQHVLLWLGFEDDSASASITSHLLAYTSILPTGAESSSWVRTLVGDMWPHIAFFVPQL